MSRIETAMILAAGRGVRMAHLTDNCPKPLIQVCGTSLLNHIIKKIEKYGIQTVVINTCYKADMIKNELLNAKIKIDFSDEETALETGGGVKKALPLLMKHGKEGFFVLNSDPLWEEPTRPVLEELAQKWNPDTMDVLLAVIPYQNAIGDDRSGDYFIEKNKLRRKTPDEKNAPYLYMGIQILHPRIFENTPDGAFGLRDLYDEAQKKNRLAHIIFDGRWFHVGTPEALEKTESLYCQKEA